MSIADLSSIHQHSIEKLYELLSIKPTEDRTFEMIKQEKEKWNDIKVRSKAELEEQILKHYQA